MPAFDGTGPRGQGSMTGRGRGYCLQSYDGVERVRYGQRRGIGGCGRRYRANPLVARDFKIDNLLTMIDDLQQQVLILAEKIGLSKDSTDDHEEAQR